MNIGRFEPCIDGFNVRVPFLYRYYTLKVLTVSSRAKRWNRHCWSLRSADSSLVEAMEDTPMNEAAESPSTNSWARKIFREGYGASIVHCHPHSCPAPNKKEPVNRRCSQSSYSHVLCHLVSCHKSRGEAGRCRSRARTGCSLYLSVHSRLRSAQRRWRRKQSPPHPLSLSRSPANSFI